MTIKTARKIRDGLVIAGIINMFLGYAWGPLRTLGAVVVISSLIPHFLFNKCPHCGKQLWRSRGDFCQFCGKRLDD